MSTDQELEIDEGDTNIEIGQFDPLKIPRLKHCDYSLFFNKFMLPNKPCIISGVTAYWPCTKLWVTDDTINYKYLTRQYGDMQVCVTNCDDKDREPDMITVGEYMQYLSGRQDEPSLYLKDWHLRQRRVDDVFYTVPKFFASDWLNEYSIDKKMDDFMFVYIGPKGSWTPLHADVYSSFSWSVNVTGCKRWVILPPGEEQKLTDSLGRLPADIVPMQGLRSIEVLQETGDAIFVPSGWHHVVYNEQDTISINHNWLNGCNLHIVWQALRLALSKVEKELDDIKYEDSFIEDCQKVLKCNHGMNYGQFVDFIMYMGKKRLEQIQKNNASIWNYRLGPRHLQFDLRSLLDVITNFLDDHSLLKVICTDKITELRMLKYKIKAICDKII